jgi:hypothetical protein
LAYVDGTLQACLGGRDLRGLTDQDRLDLAEAVGRGLPAEEERRLGEVVLQAPNTTQLAMLQALSVRFVLASAQGRERQKAFAASLLRAQPNPAVRGTMAAAALDDLAVLGLVQEAVQWTDAQRQRLPYGQGSRNNAAYALFLAGRAAEALVLAQPSVWATSGDRSHAALDTLAAALFASGDAEQAVAVQLRALGAGLVRPSTAGSRTQEPDMALPLARLAGFFLANGAYEQARLLAATALQGNDNLSAMQAARRVWKQACRGMATPGR